MAEEEGEKVPVSRKRMEMFEKAASEIKGRDERRSAYTALAAAYEPLADKERKHFESEGFYEHSSDLTKYIRYTEEVNPSKAVRLWYDVARDNLNAELPDPKVVGEAANRLDLLGYAEQAKEIRDMLRTKIKKSQEVILREAGWGGTTIKHRRPEVGSTGEHKGLAGKVSTAILVLSLLGLMGLAVGGVTGAVTGAARTSAAWNVVLALIALLSGLFLIAHKE